MRLDKVAKLLPPELFSYNLYDSSKEGDAARRHCHFNSARCLVDHVMSSAFVCSCDAGPSLQPAGGGGQKSLDDQHQETAAGA